MKLPPATRMIVREVALGLTSEEIAINHPEHTAAQIDKMRRGTTFKRAVDEMMQEIDQQVVAHAAEDPVKLYLRSKGLAMSRTLVEIAEDPDLSESARVNAANSVLDRAGYGKQQKEEVAIPILMLSPEKLNAVMNRPTLPIDIPDCVDNELTA